MHAAIQTQQPRYNLPFVVSDEKARENVRLEAKRKTEARAKKDENKKRAEALRLDRIRDHERAQAEQQHERTELARAISPDVTVEATLALPKIVHTPTPAEVGALKADVARREEARLSAFRQSEALKTKGVLLKWAEKTAPSIGDFVVEVLGALFAYSHDDGHAAVYACEGVEIRAHGAAVNPPPAVKAKARATVNPDVRRAQERRNRTAFMNDGWKEAVAIMTPAKVSPPKTDEDHARNKRIAAELKAAKDAKIAAFKAAHPKQKKAAPAATDSKKNKKGGKDKK